VLVVGAGGLGSPLLLYLAAAGVGTISIVDDDRVDLSNLQRQIIHDTGTLDQPKTASAAARLAALNPDCRIIPHQTRLTHANAAAIIADYDIVADGSDTIATRYLVNDACYLAGKTLVSAAALRFDGQLATFRRNTENTLPCYRCLFPAAPEHAAPSCVSAGVLGALTGTMGALQATEVVKEILGIGESMAGFLLLYDGLNVTFRKIRSPRDPACALCGDHPTLTSLAHHAAP
jgi:adenylyltransferase/sulfurtransferase